jgi:tetratricopeptide (TPR) repeat protein
MGRLFDREKQYEKAIAAFEKSIRINGGDLNTEKSFVGLLDKIDPPRAKPENDRLKHLFSFYGGR